MKLNFNDHLTYLSTGGKNPSSKGEALIFLPGSGQTHLTFVLQTRFLAFEGYSIYAPDFPGHGYSQGEPLETIEEMADWVAQLMNHLKIQSAVLIGHSQGCLVTITLAHKYPELAQKLILIAGALQIRVNDYLLEKSESALSDAISMMTEWGHGKNGHFFSPSQPGHSLLGIGRELMMSNTPKALNADLRACNLFDATNFASELDLPVLCILAKSDKMTPINLGIKMAHTIKDAKFVEIAKSGHMIPLEKPDEVNLEILNFIK